jgi:4-alpha-glucanotransferase
MNQRASGILLHPASLSNRYPIGDLGPATTAFADFNARDLASFGLQSDHETE